MQIYSCRYTQSESSTWSGCTRGGVSLWCTCRAVPMESLVAPKWEWGFVFPIPQWFSVFVGFGPCCDLAVSRACVSVPLLLILHVTTWFGLSRPVVRISVVCVLGARGVCVFSSSGYIYSSFVLLIFPCWISCSILIPPFPDWPTLLLCPLTFVVLHGSFLPLSQ